jgi:N-acetylmuramoyl-L-alanine amidase
MTADTVNRLFVMMETRPWPYPTPTVSFTSTTATLPDPARMTGHPIDKAGIPARPVRCDHLPYVDRLQARRLSDIDLVVIHCTELPDLATAREYGERVIYPESRTGNSGHFYIEHSGDIEQWVPLERVAHHVRGYNHHSIGIELVNRGRYPHWFHSEKQEMTEPYPTEQISGLVALLQELESKLPGLSLIAGHEDLDNTVVPASDANNRKVRRKLDPGPMFPWSEVLSRLRLERATVK